MVGTHGHVFMTSNDRNLDIAEAHPHGIRWSEFLGESPALCAGDSYEKVSQTPAENTFPARHDFEVILPNLIHKSQRRNLK